MLKSVAIIPALFLLGAVSFLMPGSSPQAPATDFKVPPDIASKTNPVKPTPEGLAHVRKVYGYDCAICHGATGDGKGDMAADMKGKLKDWRDPASLKDMTDGELFYIIQKGKGDMPAEGDRAKPDDIWNMVTVCRLFAKK